MSALEAHNDSTHELLRRFLAGYRPLSGSYDEMVDTHGRVRPQWLSLVNGIARLGPAEMERRFAASDRFLRDSGVFYRVYEDAEGAERPWPLSNIPLVISQRE